MSQYRLLLRTEVLQQLATLKQAAATQQPGGLRDREYRALKLGLRALADGREASFQGKRLGIGSHDLRDCAEIKLPVVPESRRDRELGPSHRLLYREFEAENGGPPYREVVCFEPRRNDRPFIVAADRLGRARGTRIRRLEAAAATSAIAPIRQPLPPDLRAALAAAADVAPASGAVNLPSPTDRSRTGPTPGGSPGREL